MSEKKGLQVTCMSSFLWDGPIILLIITGVSLNLPKHTSVDSPTGSFGCTPVKNKEDGTMFDCFERLSNRWSIIDRWESQRCDILFSPDSVSF